MLCFLKVPVPKLGGMGFSAHHLACNPTSPDLRRNELDVCRCRSRQGDRRPGAAASTLGSLFSRRRKSHALPNKVKAVFSCVPQNQTLIINRALCVLIVGAVRANYTDEFYIQSIKCNCFALGKCYFTCADMRIARNRALAPPRRPGVDPSRSESSSAEL